MQNLSFPHNIQDPVEHTLTVRGPAGAVSEVVQTFNAILAALADDKDLSAFAKRNGVEISLDFKRTGPAASTAPAGEPQVDDPGGLDFLLEPRPRDPEPEGEKLPVEIWAGDEDDGHAD
jgi:hypothetical protein